MQRSGSPHWDIEDDDQKLPSKTSSCTATPDPVGDNSDTDLTFNPGTKSSLHTLTAKSDVELELTPPLSRQGQKHKMMADQIAEISALECRNHIKIADIQSKAETDRSNECKRIKCCANLEMEATCLEHAA